MDYLQAAGMVALVAAGMGLEAAFGLVAKVKKMLDGPSNPPPPPKNP